MERSNTALMLSWMRVGLHGPAICTVFLWVIKDRRVLDNKASLIVRKEVMADT
jgi:hypothetical protein